MASSRKSPPIEAEALFQRFDAFASDHFTQARLAVAYSGGLDSTVLLHLAQRWCAAQSVSLQAFHAHHGISPNAERWLAHCEAQCAALTVPFSFARLVINVAAPDSLEARARRARYEAFAALDATDILLAHHRDDQVETVLYRLVRGTGVHGAAGMPQFRFLAPGKRIVRPLLGESRSVLECYAAQHGLVWVDDESNLSRDYDRNYLRHDIATRLKARFPAADSAIARAARHFAEAASLLDALAEADADLSETGRLSVKRLMALDASRQRNLLRWYLARHDVRPDERQLRLFLAQLCDAAPDLNPCLRLADHEVHRYRGEVWVGRRFAAPQPVVLCGASPLVCPTWGGVLDWQSGPNGIADSQLAELSIRQRVGGESLRPRVGGPRRSLKLLLQEAGVPPWLRVSWPLLWAGDRLVAVPGIAVDADFQGVEGALWPTWHPEGWPDFAQYAAVNQGAGA